MAEALRAYMTDPNYIKTVAPKTAMRIRDAVNNNKQLRDIIQFNSVLGGVPNTSRGVSGTSTLSPFKLST